MKNQSTVLGLRGKESPEFLTFFALVQLEAKKQNSVFFLDSGEGNQYFGDGIECEDLFGYLVPTEYIAPFNKDFLENKPLEKWSRYSMFVDWHIVDGEVIVEFNRYAVDY